MLNQFYHISIQNREKCIAWKFINLNYLQMIFTFYIVLQSLRVEFGGQLLKIKKESIIFCKHNVEIFFLYIFMIEKYELMQNFIIDGD